MLGLGLMPEVTLSFMLAITAVLVVALILASRK